MTRIKITKNININKHKVKPLRAHVLDITYMYL